MGPAARGRHAPAPPLERSLLDSRPSAGTIEAWCWELVTSTVLASKLAPAPAPAADDPSSWESAPPARRIAAPGRPPELELRARAPRTSGAGALRDARTRARLLHTFLHHELQAAELVAWAILAFPRAPRAFRTGLLRLCQEELAHLGLYAEHLARLGFAVGAFAVRDWLWERVSAVADARAFVALLGLGFEGANLDHSARFAAALRAAGDSDAARILERIERDEVGHVAFAARWFAELSGAPLDYARWRAALPAPLTPALLRGRPLNRGARMRAGFDAAFLARLESEPATSTKGRA